MLLQQIVSVFDRELERLQHLRSIVASLEGSTELLLAEAAQSADQLGRELRAQAEGIAPAGTPQVRRRGRPRKQGTEANARHEAKSSVALSGTIPTGPVIITRDALARERETRSRAHEEKAPEAPVGTLGAMIKALELQNAH